MNATEMVVGRKVMDLASETLQQMCRQSHKTDEELRDVCVTIVVENLEDKGKPHKITARREKL